MTQETKVGANQLRTPWLKFTHRTSIS